MRHPIACHLPYVLASTLALIMSPAKADNSLPSDLLVDYQLGNAYPPSAGVTAVVRDSTANPAPGLFNICYVNGYQTQPGTIWPADLLVPGPDGTPLSDPNWPDEFIFDVSTPELRIRNLQLILPMLQSCEKKGFVAVEFDNLDSYSRSNRHISLDDSVAFAKMLVDAAHDMSLAAGQKNTSELGTRARDEIGFDFAVVEECYRWDECAAYTEVYGDQVIGIEYADDLRGSFGDACTDFDRPRSLILRDRMLTPAGHPNYVFDHC